MEHESVCSICLGFMARECAGVARETGRASGSRVQSNGALLKI